MTNQECPMSLLAWCSVEHFHGKGKDRDFFGFNCFLLDAVDIYLFNSDFG